MGFSVKTKFTVKLILTVKYCLHGSHSKERDRRGGKINSRSHAPVRRFDSQRIYIGRVSVSTVSPPPIRRMQRLSEDYREKSRYNLDFDQFLLFLSLPGESRETHK